MPDPVVVSASAKHTVLIMINWDTFDCKFCPRPLSYFFMGLVTLGMVGQLLSQRSDLLMSRCKKSCDFQSHYQTDRLNIFFKCFFLQVICPTANKMPVTLNSGKNSLPEHLVAIDMKDNHQLRSPASCILDDSHWCFHCRLWDAVLVRSDDVGRDRTRGRARHQGRLHPGEPIFFSSWLEKILKWSLQTVWSYICFCMKDQRTEFLPRVRWTIWLLRKWRREFPVTGSCLAAFLRSCVIFSLWNFHQMIPDSHWSSSFLPFW